MEEELYCDDAVRILAKYIDKNLIETDFVTFLEIDTNDYWLSLSEETSGDYISLSFKQWNKDRKVIDRECKGFKSWKNAVEWAEICIEEVINGE